MKIKKLFTKKTSMDETSIAIERVNSGDVAIEGTGRLRPTKVAVVTIAAIAIAAAIAVALLLSLVTLAVLAGNGNLWGVRGIRITENRSDEMSLRINYIGGTGSCSVRMLEKDEPLALPEGQEPIYMGEYRIQVWFGDMLSSKALAEKYPYGMVYELKDVPRGLTSTIKIRVIHLPHELIIYLGSDEPINVTEQRIKLNEVFGTVAFTLE